VNNAIVGARVRTKAEILGAAAPQGGKRHGGLAENASTRVEGVTAGFERGETSEGRVPMDDPA
jgi:hypothetical protein